MEQPEKKFSENNFAKFITMIVIIAFILVFISLYLYYTTGTEDLDRSLPKYVLNKN